MRHRVLFAAASALTLAGVAQATSITYSVDPKSSYFLAEQSQNPDQPADPLFISFNLLGLGAGQQVTISGNGDVCYWGPARPELPAGFGGVFTTSNWLGPADLQQRLSAVGIAPPSGATKLTDPPTFYSHSSTNVPQDFIIPLFPSTVTVTIPSGASYLAIGIVDSYYRDNANPYGKTISVTIAWQPVPEPGTCTLILIGFSGILALRRRKR